MAYVGNQDYLLLFLPEALLDDMSAASFIRSLGEEAQPAGASEPEPRCGFIVRDWFGPFLLSPPSRYLHGWC
jgi:hypothetical protein